MSVRLVLSVVFTVVLLAAVTPAIEDARDVGRAAEADRAIGQLTRTATALVERGDPPPAGVPGARRHLDLSLPEGVAVTVTNGSSVPRSRIDDEPVAHDVLPRAAWTREADFTLTGDVHLVIRYERRDGRSVLVFSRGFIRKGAAKRDHVQSPVAHPTARSSERVSRVSVPDRPGSPNRQPLGPMTTRPSSRRNSGSPRPTPARNPTPVSRPTRYR